MMQVIHFNGILLIVRQETMINFLDDASIPSFSINFTCFLYPIKLICLRSIKCTEFQDKEILGMYCVLMAKRTMSLRIVLLFG